MHFYTRTAVVSMGLLFCGLSASAAATPAQVRTVRWFVAHDRGDTPFAALIKNFAQSLGEKSNGALKVVFIDSQVPEAQLDEAAFNNIAEGRADLAQIPARSAGVGIFDVPFLFRSYDHAELIFSGPIGKKLVANVAASSNQRVRGLAFTYSGGYRILVGRVPIRRLGDLKELRMRRESGLPELMQEWGIRQVETDPKLKERPIAQVGAGLIDLEETEVNRLAITQSKYPEILRNVKFANLTRHRMYVTALVANEKFLESLPVDLRQLLTAEIEALAVAERKLSVSLEKSNLAFLEKGGLKLVEFSEAERRAFIKSGEAVYKKHPELSGLIRDIREIKALSGS